MARVELRCAVDGSQAAVVVRIAAAHSHCEQHHPHDICDNSSHSKSGYWVGLEVDTYFHRHCTEAVREPREAEGVVGLEFIVGVGEYYV